MFLLIHIRPVLNHLLAMNRCMPSVYAQFLLRRSSQWLFVEVQKTEQLPYKRITITITITNSTISQLISIRTRTTPVIINWSISFYTLKSVADSEHYLLFPWTITAANRVAAAGNQPFKTRLWSKFKPDRITGSGSIARSKFSDNASPIPRRKWG